MDQLHEIDMMAWTEHYREGQQHLRPASRAFWPLLQMTVRPCLVNSKTSIAGAYSVAGPVAQSVERWTPCGGSTRPGFKSPGFEARRAPDVYRASWRVWLRLVAGRSQLKPAIGTGRARLCAYVKLSTLNSAIDPELRDRKVEDRANATSSA